MCHSPFATVAQCTTVSVSSDYEVDIEIVGWVPQLTSRLFNTILMRMIDNSVGCIYPVG